MKYNVLKVMSVASIVFSVGCASIINDKTQSIVLDHLLAATSAARSTAFSLKDQYQFQLLELKQIKLS